MIKQTRILHLKDSYSAAWTAKPETFMERAVSVNLQIETDGHMDGFKSPESARAWAYKEACRSEERVRGFIERITDIQAVGG